MKPALPALLSALLLSACATSGTAPAEKVAASPTAAPGMTAAPPPAPAATTAAPPAENGQPAKAESEGRPAASPALPHVALTPKLLYQILIAEIASQRGQAAAAAEVYRDLARLTRDPRLARRTAELAMQGQRVDLAIDAARLWQDIEPQSRHAGQALVTLLASEGRIDELRPEIARLLAAEPEYLIQNLLHLNRIFGRSQDRQAVRLLIDSATEPYLKHPEAWFARAQAALDTRDKPAAREAIRQARELRPDWEVAVLFQLQLLDNPQEALQMMADFVSAHPRSHDVRLAYARTLVNDKRYAEARKEFSTLLELGAKDPAKNGDIIFAVALLSLQLNETEEAERHLRQLIEIGHIESDKARYYLGQIAEDGKRPDEALRWFGEVGRGEHYLPARLHAASLLAKRGNLPAARTYLAETLTDKPREQIQLLIGEAQLLRDAGQIREAHDVLAVALEKQPDQPELLYEVALLAERLGRFDELETRLRRLIALRPDHAHALNALGYAFADRNERLPEARELIDRALELAPNDPFILDSKGWVLFRQGALEPALNTLERAFSLRADPEIAAHLGEVMWMFGQRDEARRTWEKAQRAHPGNEVLHNTMKRFLP